MEVLGVSKITIILRNDNHAQDNFAIFITYTYKIH